MIKRLIIITAIVMLAAGVIYKDQINHYSEREKNDFVQREPIATLEREPAYQPLDRKPDRIVYGLDNRAYDETKYDEKLMERALLYIENFPEDSAVSPSIEGTLYREWLKKTAILTIADADESKINIVINAYLSQQGMISTEPSSITYHNGYPFIKYYDDEKSGKFAFVAIIPDYDDSFASVYCGVANIEDLKKEGRLVYDFDQEGRLLSEIFYNNQGRQMADLSYKYDKTLPFPIIKTFNNSIEENGRFYSLPYMNTGQRFWVEERLMEMDATGIWIKYNGDIYNDFQYEEEIESDNTPVYSDTDKLQEIIET